MEVNGEQTTEKSIVGRSDKEQGGSDQNTGVQKNTQIGATRGNWIASFDSSILGVENKFGVTCLLRSKLVLAFEMNKTAQLAAVLKTSSPKQLANCGLVSG